MIIHHSAGTNVSSDWAAVVRSIWNYHVNTNGWADVGYNWLVDPNGILYEGRGDNVTGAHFCGANGNTMGVCMMGDFTTITPTSDAVNTLTELFAWKSCDANINPLDSAYHGSSALILPHISGHRDGCATACPGDAFYPMIPSIRSAVQTQIDSCVSQPPALDAPTDLAATTLSSTSIELNWVDNSTNEDSFIIERSVMFNTFYNKIGTVGADVTTFTDNNLTPQTGYFYKVKAANATDTSDFSNEVFVATQSSNVFLVDETASIDVYPNPIEDVIFIKIDNQTIGNIQIDLSDATGRKVIDTFSSKKWSANFETQLNLQTLPKGMYLLHIQIDGKTWVKRLVK